MYKHRILRVLCAKLRLEGDFDYSSLAKATPGYVGADLSALTGAAGVIAVKRIFREISEGILTLPDAPEMTTDNTGTPMVIDSTPHSPTTEAPPPSYPIRPFASLVNQLSSSSIAHFLTAHPSPLTESQLAPLCITSSDFRAALSEVQPSSKREGFATVPDVTWSDIGALHGIREELQMAIVQPIRRPELFSAVGIDAACGVLLWGPPGCGKTLLAKAVANESKANFISIKGPELLNKVGRSSWVKETDSDWAFG
jgi:ribosome biogenesis ATPase